jgi:hypothetical protein
MACVAKREGTWHCCRSSTSVCGPLHTVSVGNAFCRGPGAGATCLDKSGVGAKMRLYLLRRILAAGVLTVSLDIRLRLGHRCGRDHHRNRNRKRGHRHRAQYKTFHIAPKFGLDPEAIAPNRCLAEMMAPVYRRCLDPLQDVTKHGALQSEESQRWRASANLDTHALRKISAVVPIRPAGAARRRRGSARARRDAVRKVAAWCWPVVDARAAATRTSARARWPATVS